MNQSRETACLASVATHAVLALLLAVAPTRILVTFETTRAEYLWSDGTDFEPHLHDIELFETGSVGDDKGPVCRMWVISEPKIRFTSDTVVDYRPGPSEVASAFLAALSEHEIDDAVALLTPAAQDTAQKDGRLKLRLSRDSVYGAKLAVVAQEINGTDARVRLNWVNSRDDDGRRFFVLLRSCPDGWRVRAFGRDIPEERYRSHLNYELMKAEPATFE